MLLSKWYLRLLLCLSLIVATLAVPLLADEPVPTDPLRIGIFADLHAHDTNSPVEGHVYTNYGQRLQAFAEAMNAWPADLVIELGDFINGRYVMPPLYGDSERITGILEEAEAIYATFNGPRYYVLGNHEMYDLSKEEFLERVACDSTYGSFDVDGYHFVILDAQYNKKGEDFSEAFWVVQGNVPQAQLDWLREDLSTTDKSTVVCIHQPLDLDFSPLAGGGPPV
ncbi:unnamed protein product, partial [marine sediment metagenome]